MLLILIAITAVVGIPDHWEDYAGINVPGNPGTAEHTSPRINILGAAGRPLRPPYQTPRPYLIFPDPAQVGPTAGVKMAGPSSEKLRGFQVRLKKMYTAAVTPDCLPGNAKSEGCLSRYPKGYVPQDPLTCARIVIINPVESWMEPAKFDLTKQATGVTVPRMHLLLLSRVMTVGGIALEPFADATVDAYNTYIRNNVAVDVLGCPPGNYKFEFEWSYDPDGSLHKVQNEYFRRIDQSITWGEAKVKCTTLPKIYGLSPELVTIKADDEIKFLTTAPSMDSWLCSRGHYDKNDWVWKCGAENGQPTLLNWESGEPNNQGWLIGALVNQYWPGNALVMRANGKYDDQCEDAQIVPGLTVPKICYGPLPGCMPFVLVPGFCIKWVGCTSAVMSPNVCTDGPWCTQKLDYSYYPNKNQFYCKYTGTVAAPHVPNYGTVVVTVRTYFSTRTATPELTPTHTIQTPTPSATLTPTNTPTDTPTHTPSQDPTATDTGTKTNSPEVMSFTQSLTDTDTETNTDSPEVMSFTQSLTDTETETKTDSPEVMSFTQSLTQTDSMTDDATDTKTNSPKVMSFMQSSTETLSDSARPSGTKTDTPEVMSFTQSLTQTDSMTDTQSDAATHTASRTPSVTLTDTEVLTSSETFPQSHTLTLSEDETMTPSETQTDSRTATSDVTLTTSMSETDDESATPSIGSHTPSETISNSETLELSMSHTSTNTMSDSDSLSISILKNRYTHSINTPNIVLYS